MKLLYFAPVPWDTYEQRPHYVVRHFLARGGRDVLWVDPYPTRLPSPADRHRLTQPALSPLPRPDGLEVLKVRSLPIEPLPAGAWINRASLWRPTLTRMAAFARTGDLTIGIGRPSALAWEALRQFEGRWSFYDAMDDFPEFYTGLARVAQRHHEYAIAGRVTTVYVSSSALARKFAARRQATIRLLNAFDMALLGDAPLALAPTRAVVGYVGTIGRWFDWSVVRAIVETAPDVLVRLIGPCFVPPAAPLPDNVQVEPMCDQATAVARMRGFSVGLIPFMRTRLTESVDPIKYYAYRGLGLPVLSTAFGEMAGRTGEPGTFVVGEAADLRATVADALACRLDPAELRRFRRANDWSRRFDEAGLFEEGHRRAECAAVATAP